MKKSADYRHLSGWKQTPVQSGRVIKINCHTGRCAIVLQSSRSLWPFFVPADQSDRPRCPQR